MAAITPTPLYFDDCALSIGADEYAAGISSAVLTPTPNVSTFNGLKPNAEFHASRVTWTLDITFVQDWGSATSLSRKLLTSQGTVITGVTLKPVTAGLPTFTCDVHILPGSVGGATRAHATSQVSMPLKGQPVFTAV